MCSSDLLDSNNLSAKCVLIISQMSEKPECLYPVSVTGDVDPEVLYDADMVRNAQMIEICQPMLTDKLPVSQQALDVFNAEQTDKMFQQINAFLGRRITEFRHHSEEQRKCNAFIHNR